MDNKAQPIAPLTLEIKALVSALTLESFNFRSRSHVNVTTCATDPSISVFVYIDNKAEKSYTIFLNDHDAATQLNSILDEVREFKRVGTFNLNLKLVS